MDREGKLFEFSITGVFTNTNRDKIDLICREECQNDFNNYNYKIETFLLSYDKKQYELDFHYKSESFLSESQEFSTLLEYHQNLNEEPYKHKFKLDQFFNNVNYLNKLDEYLKFSKFFVKSISNSYLQDFPIGHLSIVEISRCEEKMDLIIDSLGYEKKSNIIKNGKFIVYKNMPIIILYYGINLEFKEKINDFVREDNERMMREANARKPKDFFQQDFNNNRNTNLEMEEGNRIDYIIEILGYSREEEKSAMMESMKKIKDELSGLCVFE